MLATVYAVLVVLSPGWFVAASGVRAALLGLVVATGSAGVACSVLVYHVVRRPFWQASYGGFKFAGTAVVLGLAAALAATSIAALGHPAMPPGAASWRPLTLVALGLIAAISAKLWFEARLVRGYARSELSSLRKTALLLGGPLGRPAGLRRLLGVVGGVVLPALAVMEVATANPGAAAADCGSCPGSLDRRRDGRAIPLLHRGGQAEDAGRADAVKTADGSPSLLHRTLSLVRACDGRLTRELLRAPGRFGLGQVPAGKTPHATTGMVCGFCSTGCGLTIHLRDGAGGEPHADDRTPGQPWHGLLKGLGSLERPRRRLIARPCRSSWVRTAAGARWTGTPPSPR